MDELIQVISFMGLKVKKKFSWAPTLTKIWWWLDIDIFLNVTVSMAIAQDERKTAFRNTNSL